MTFAYPWVLFLLILLGLFALQPVRRRESLPIASLLLWQEADLGRARWLWMLRFLRTLALALLIVALARPQAGSTKTMQVSEGIAIQLLVDVSSSMDMSMDLPDGGRKTRMEVAKELVELFINGDGGKLTGRTGDLIGLITFARYPDTRSPLTFGHPALIELVRDLSIQDRPNEDGTAYGDALALAAARLKHLDEMETDQSVSFVGDVASRVIILLTDGENNSGNHLPLEAAGLAKKWDCRIYCISLGDPLPASPTTGLSQLSSSERILEHISKETGGIFRKAFDYESLRSVYEEIDQLEQSEISNRAYTQVSEWFWLPALAALVSLTLALVLEATWLRTAP
ncbi:MAG: VWA domain-containing protein [Puniceicoccaceae bacterium]